MFTIEHGQPLSWHFRSVPHQELHIGIVPAPLVQTFWPLITQSSRPTRRFSEARHVEPAEVRKQAAPGFPRRRLHIAFLVDPQNRMDHVGPHMPRPMRTGVARHISTLSVPQIRTHGLRHARPHTLPADLANLFSPYLSVLAPLAAPSFQPGRGRAAFGVSALSRNARASPECWLRFVLKSMWFILSLRCVCSRAQTKFSFQTSAAAYAEAWPRYRKRSATSHVEAHAPAFDVFL